MDKPVMKVIVVLIAMWTQAAGAGLPPTTSKGSGDTGNLTTFNFQFPNLTVTHTGTTALFDLPNIVSAGSCSNCNLTYDAKGRIIVAANGGGGSSALPVTTKTANYTATSTDNVILLNGTFTITLPSAALNSGQVLNLKMIAAGTVTITPNGGDTVEFNSSGRLMVKGENLTIVSDGGTNWYAL